MELTDLTNMKDPDKMNYAARMALILYQLEDGNEEEDYTGTTPPKSYITVHRIQNGAICEGRPVSRQSLVSLCRLAMPSLKADTEYIPENVLAYAPLNNTLIWWMPEGTRTLFYSKEMKIKSGKAPIPPLVFYYYNRVIRVFAIRDNKRPSPETEIYHAPFFNGTCMGNVSIPERAKPSDIPRLESLYFDSEFTGHSTPKLKGTTGYDLWRSITGKKNAVFPKDCLVKAGTLDGIFKGNISAY